MRVGNRRIGIGEPQVASGRSQIGGHLREASMAERDAVSALSGVVLLRSFAEAFNWHDLDRLMSMMTEDCVFDASSGPEAWGTRYTGQSQVRDSFAAIFRMFPDASWTQDRHFVDGDRGLSEWLFTGTHVATGAVVRVHGCDIFTLRDGKIAIKDSYRKTVVAK